jgi:hypothetical protein
MRPAPKLHWRLTVVTAMLAVPLSLRATISNPADNSIRQFLAQNDDLNPYRATRRLEAENGDRKGWLEAVTQYSTAGGFTYTVTAEGGSSFIRTNVLRAALDEEGEAIAHGETSRSALALANYAFQANGVDAEGLANVLLAPRRKERGLVTGTMFLRPDAGDLVRLQGRLARNPSFWVRNVDIVRSYARFGGEVMPIVLEAKAQVRLLGPALFRMTYTYSEVDDQPLAALR